MTPAIESAEEYTPAKNEAYMSAKQLVHFTRMLEQWKASILSESEKIRKYLQDERAQTADLNDRASQEEEFSLALRTRDRERKLLRKIDKALERIKQGTFGYCEQCDEEIGLRRLEARPTAELCIDCKHLAERKEKGFYDAR